MLNLIYVKLYEVHPINQQLNETVSRKFIFFEMVIMSLFEIVRLSVSDSLRYLYNSLKRIEEI